MGADVVYYLLSDGYFSLKKMNLEDKFIINFQKIIFFGESWLYSMHYSNIQSARTDRVNFNSTKGSKVSNSLFSINLDNNKNNIS